jgi:hypothetical protein
MTTARKLAICMKAEEAVVDEEEGLECKPELLLYAFKVTMPYATGKSNTAKLEHNQELALSLVDWALMECDRGLEMLKLRTEMDLKPRPPTVNWP